MRRRILFAVGSTIVVLLCLALLVRYVDIPGTEWDNFLDLSPLIKLELRLRMRMQ